LSVSSPLAPAEDARHTQILDEVREALVEVIGEDYLVDFPITWDTSFEADLQLESVEFVALSENLQHRYPDVDFVAWIADMEVHDLMQLRVGKLVEFILTWPS
jgi:acyl carrier protein